jgi:Virus neck protein
MTTNPYLSRYMNDSERTLNEDLLIEFIQTHGMDVIYLPRVLISKSEVMNEVITSYHGRGMKIEMVPVSYESTDQNDMAMSVFGLMAMPNSSEWEVSRRRFKECVDENRLAFGDRPNEGDIFYSADMGDFFVIKKVNKDDPTKSKDRWKLRCIKYDAADNVSIDTQDFVEETGLIDHRMEFGFGEYSGADFLSKEILSDSVECVDFDIDKSMSAADIDLAIEKAEEAANRKTNASRVNTINASETSALHISSKMESILERDVK